MLKALVRFFIHGWLLLLAIGLVAGGIRGVAFAVRSKSWPTTPGVIVRSEIRNTGSGRGTRFEPLVTYRYSVGQDELEGTKIRGNFAKRFRDSKQARKFLGRRYEVGAKVTVHYNPSRPGEAFLVRESMASSIIMLLCGLGLGAYVLRFAKGSPFAFFRSRRKRFEAFNFELAWPRGWKWEDGESGSTYLGCLERRGVYLHIWADAVKLNALPTAETVAKNRLDRYESGSTGFSILRREKAVLHGLEGVRAEFTGAQDGTEYQWVGFFRGHRGFSHELVLAGPPKRLSNGRGVELFEKLVEHFQVLDPKRSSYTLLPEFEGNWESSEHGYCVDLPKGGWRQWAGEPAASADFGLFQDKGVVATVSTFQVPDERPSFEDVTESLLATYGIEPQESGLRILEDETRGDQRVRTYVLQRRMSLNEYAYRMRVTSSPHAAQFACVVAEPDNDALDDAFTEFVGGIRFPDPAREAIWGEDWSSSAKKLHEGVLEELAQRNMNRSKFVEAERCWRRVLEVAPTREDAANSLLLCLCRREAWDGLLKEAPLLVERFPDNLALAAFEPFAHVKKGELADAARGFRAVFERGWRDYADREAFVRVLLDLGEDEEAETFARTCLAEGDTSATRKLMVKVPTGLDRQDEAIELLRQSTETKPDDVDAKLELVDGLIAVERYEDAIATTNEALKLDPNSLRGYYLRGVAEARIKRWKHARTSFQAALEKNPADPDVQSWLDHVTRQLGQGDNRLLRRHLEPVDLPPADPVDIGSVVSDTGAANLEFTYGIHFQRGHDLTRER